MREFYAVEYVDGEVKVYVREKGQDDSAWKELGTVNFECRRKYDTVTIAGALKVEPELAPEEVSGLSMVLAWPRRL